MIHDVYLHYFSNKYARTRPWMIPKYVKFVQNLTCICFALPDFEVSSSNRSASTLSCRPSFISLHVRHFIHFLHASVFLPSSLIKALHFLFSILWLLLLLRSSASILSCVLNLFITHILQPLHLLHSLTSATCMADIWFVGCSSFSGWFTRATVVWLWSALDLLISWRKMVFRRKYKWPPINSYDQLTLIIFIWFSVSKCIWDSNVLFWSVHIGCTDQNAGLDVSGSFYRSRHTEQDWTCFKLGFSRITWSSISQSDRDLLIAHASLMLIGWFWKTID